MTTANEIHDEVKKRYGEAARTVGKSGCCGGEEARGIGGTDPITRGLYGSESSEVPADALAASLGCGNPTSLAELKAGETVLDLGSGGGIDVLLSARRVGATGKAYGLDMTPDMLALARANQRKAGATNVEFLEGNIEAIPLPDAAVNVIISNCVVNLSPDKDRVLAEAFRVLAPGGRLAIADIVLRKPLDEAQAKSLALWTGCVAGALVDGDYRAKLARAGFVDVSIEPTREYTGEDAKALTEGAGCGTGGCGPTGCGTASLDGVVMSAFIRARKPAAG